MTRSPSTLELLLVRALTAALLLGVLDAVIGNARRGPEPTTWGEQLEALRFAVALVLVAYLAASIPLAALRRWLGLNPAALSAALFVGLLVAVVDVDLNRWEAVNNRASAAVSSLERGLLAGFLAYLALSRVFLRSVEAPGRAHAGLAVVGALAVAGAPFLADRSEASIVRDVRGGHRIPRVLMIVVDTLRADALSYASATAPPTPEIDRLASTSVAFTNTHTPGAWTLPSVASLMTGVSPLVHGAVTRFSALPENLPTLAERMARNGYRTGAIGHNFVLSETRKLDRGFDTYRFGKRRVVGVRSVGFLRVVAKHRAQHRSELTAEEINELAFDWLEAQRDEDFFLWLHYYDPHLVYDPPADLRPQDKPPSGMNYRYGHENLADLRAGYQVPDLDRRRWVKSLYDAEVRAFDRALGQLLRKLSELGMYEDTLIVLTSDHGEEFWEHEGFEHGHTLYGEVIDVPLLVKLPGQTAGTVVSTPASLENLLPSILTLCEIDYEPADLSASSLFDVDGGLLEEITEPRASTGTCYFQDRVAVFFSDWKYIRWFVTGAEELYDLGSDPGEVHSLVASHPRELEEGRRRCDRILSDAEKMRERLGLAGSAEAALTQAELESLQDLGYAAGGQGGH